MTLEKVLLCPLNEPKVGSSKHKNFNSTITTATTTNKIISTFRLQIIINIAHAFIEMKEG